MRMFKPFPDRLTDRAYRREQIKNYALHPRDGSKQRVYAVISGDDERVFIDWGSSYTHLDLAFGPGIAAVSFIRHINYTYLRIRRGWYNKNLSDAARRWHLTQIHVLWIMGDISRAECVRIVQDEYRWKHRPCMSGHIVAIAL